MSRVDWHYWETFLREVADSVASLPSSPPWYRGVADERHTCIPSLLRYKNGIAKEGQLFQRFEQLARGVHRQGPSLRSDWEVLYEMQHYGIPTRLLDWSEVFGIALFFACLGPDDSDSFIYILAPEALNTRQGKANLVGHWDQSQFNYREFYVEAKPLRPSTPLAINPEHINERLAAQRGRFTIHGEDRRPVEESVPECVRKVKLSRDAKPAAREYLRLFGIDEFDIFPDLQGASMFLPRIVGLL